jgi:hypothetical protein
MIGNAMYMASEYRPVDQYKPKPLIGVSLMQKEEQVFKYIKNGSLDKVMSCAVCGMCG